MTCVTFLSLAKRAAISAMFTATECDRLGAKFGGKAHIGGRAILVFRREPKLSRSLNVQRNPIAVKRSGQTTRMADKSRRRRAWTDKAP